jgi:ribosomal protein S27AE
MSTTTRLACPRCGSGDNLWSDEAASIMYPVRLTREAGDTTADVEYTGESYEVQDEGTVYVGDIWCRNCGIQLTEHDLIDPDAEDEDDLEGSLDLPEALERARQYLNDATVAVADEHEGNLKKALWGLRAVSSDVADLVERW